MIGSNGILNGSPDVAAVVARLKAYCLARRAVGYKIVMCTVLPNGSITPLRASYNAAIRADASYYDALADFDTTEMGASDTAYANATNYPDGLHPSLAGYTIIAPVIAAAHATAVALYP